MFCQHHASRSQYHTISLSPALSTILFLHHRLSPPFSILHAKHHHLSLINSLAFGLSFSSSFLTIILCIHHLFHHYPLWFSPIVTVILFLYCLLSPSLFSLVILYNLKIFVKLFALFITLSQHHSPLQSLPLLPWSALLSFKKNCKD